MAPRKSDSSKTKKVERKKVTKQKIEKPKLKTPTTIRIKIPIAGNSGTVTSNTPIKYTKKLSVQKKVELANEVALQQLDQNYVIPEEPPQTAVTTRKVRKKLTSKPRAKEKVQKTVSDFFTKKSTKDAASNPNTKGPVKSVADSTIKLLKKSRKKQVENANEPKPKKPTLRRRAPKNEIKENKDSVAPTEKNNIKCESKHSRTNSMNSNSNLSWTRDISSSSTTTCVTVASNEIVRYDNKLPVVHLLKIDDIIRQKNKIPSSSESDSDTTDSECSDTLFSDIAPEKSLNLSKSSLEFSENKGDDSNLDKCLFLLKQVQNTCNNVDLEYKSWLKFKNDQDYTISDKDLTGIELLTFESMVTNEFRNLYRIVHEKECEKDVEENTQETENNVALVQSNDINNHESDIDDCKSPLSVGQLTNSPREVGECYDSDSITENVNYTSFDDNFDDDDTLSLFAESIADLDHSKVSSHASTSKLSADDHEEYVPKPVMADVRRIPEMYTYQPTRIDNNKQKIKPQCEKQNADSTSLHIDGIPKIVEPIVTVTNNFKSYMTNLIKYTSNANKPLLISSMFRPLHGIKSVVYKGVCFYNLISGCKLARCRFPHQTPDSSAVSQTLTTLNDDQFIQEYMLLRNFPNLRRIYGLCYVRECQKRAENDIHFSRILVEMGMDFATKANPASVEDHVLKVTVLETVLMHLNTINLDICSDLLKAAVFCGDRLIFYSVLMQAISDTQNFARFRTVFGKLVNFVIVNGGTFDLDVANKILERVCILPSEESLARAMLNVMQHTDSTILQNNRLPQFELMLSNLDSNILNEFRSIKEKLNVDMNNVNNIPHQSPDTTNLDSLIKPVVEPKITRTINFKPNIAGTQPKKFPVPNVPPNHTKKPYENRRSPFALRFTRPLMPVGVTKRGSNQRQVTYRPPTRFMRR